MGYFSVHEVDNEKDSVQLQMNEQDAQYQELTDKFKEFFAGLEFKPLTQTKVSVCNVKPENLKQKYSIDSYGCTTLDYSDLLAFLNSLRVEGQIAEKVVKPVVVEKPTPVKK